jgi:predicted naringenin-chalcone synthase
MSLAIAALGTALPPTSLTQAEAVRLARAVCCRSEHEATWLPSIYGGSGIETRHLAFDRAIIQDILDGTRHSGSPFLPAGRDDDSGPTGGQRMRHYQQQAPPLAQRAARAALHHSKLPPSVVTHLLTVSCTGFFAPGLDILLIKMLGLRPTVSRTHIGFMGCHGALNALRVADAFARADRRSCVLICAVELCGLHYHYRWDPQKMIANALFSDGAAAVVGVPDSAALADAWRVAATGSCVFADSEAAMTWTIGDYNFEMTLGKCVPSLIAQNLRPWLSAWLAENELTIAQVASWAVHPGGPRILVAVEEALDFGRHTLDDSKAVLAECGNMSSPTLLFILDRLQRRNAPRPCVALGFGPGLVAEAVLFQ